MKNNIHQPQATTAEVQSWLIDVARFCARIIQESPDPHLMVSKNGFRIILYRKLTDDFDHWWQPAQQARWN